jgi:hypothetical protein
MPTNLEDWAMPKGQPCSQEENQLKSTLSAKPANMQDNGPAAKMPCYIGTKVVCAIPMDEVSFLLNYKNQPDNDNETRPGYLVQYEDGYKSWSPKETFERSYRLITHSERILIV